MLTALVSFHVIICILLTVVVLLQFGKGAEVGAVMGGGASQQVFSSNSKGNFFTKATTTLAILFMVNSIALTHFKAKSTKSSIFDGDDSITPSLGVDQPIAEPAKETEKATKATEPVAK